jgi:FeS assembly SUF system protein
MSNVKCLRCGQDAPGIPEERPYPGDLGKMIAEHVCLGCWEAWKKFSVNVINDYKLRPFLPQDRAVVERHMKQYLNLELQGVGGLQPIAAQVLTLEGQGKAVTFNTANQAAANAASGVTKEAVVGMLEQIFDPEIPVNIYDLGLIYGIDIAGDKVAVKMTLTSRHCPAAQSLPATVREAVARIPGVREADVDIVWDPPWTKEKISEDGRKILGL